MSWLKNFFLDSKMKEAKEWVVTILAAILIYIIIQAFFFKTANVVGSSMEPTFNHGERVMVTRFSYWFSGPKFNDVIAFPFKEDREQKFIKRVIGLPGDEIDLQDNLFVLNGVPITDNNGAENITAHGNLEFPIVVPENCYFVLGDNRNGSKDSRYSEVGCIPRSDVIGKVSFRFWPLNKFEFFK